MDRSVVFKDTDSKSEVLYKLQQKAQIEVNVKYPNCKKKFRELFSILRKNKRKFIKTEVENEEIFQTLVGSCLTILTRKFDEPKGTILIKDIYTGMIYQYEGYYPAYFVISLFYRDGKYKEYQFKYTMVPDRQIQKYIHLPEKFLELLNAPILCPHCGENINLNKTKQKFKLDYSETSF